MAWLNTEVVYPPKTVTHPSTNGARRRVTSLILHNGLQLNPSKSEVIQFTAGRGREQVDDVSSLQVSDAAIQPSPTIKTLGVTLDRLLTFDQHVANVCKAGYFHIRALRHVRQSLPDDVARIVACSIVNSRLDYCNSLFVQLRWYD